MGGCLAAGFSPLCGRVVMRRLLFKLAAIAILLWLATIQPVTAGPCLSRQSEQIRPTITRYDQVKLRKLHLVRPDLIPFPIIFEVYC